MVSRRPLVVADGISQELPLTDTLVGGIPLGGTVGQFLAKSSATDGDVGWATPPSVGPKGARSIAGSGTVISSDAGTLLNLSGTGILSLTAAAALGAGFYFYVSKKDGAGNILIDPAGTETIEGLSSISIYQESYLIYTDGVAWYCSGRPKGWIPTTKVSNSGSLGTSFSFTSSVGFQDTEISKVAVEIHSLTLSAAAIVAVQVRKGGSFKTGTNVVEETIRTATTAVAATSANGVSNGVTLINTSSAGPIIATLRALNTQSAVAAETRIELEAFQAGASKRGWFYEATAAKLEGFSLSLSAGSIASYNYSASAYRP